MRDKKGFTLVELLAVIAILAILVIIAMPNVLKLFNEAKKSSFITEAQEIAKNSTSKYIKESLSGKIISKISSNDDTRLDLSGGDVDYYLELDNKGNITYLEVTNDSFCLQTDKNYKDITKEDVIDGRCDPSNRLTEEQKEIATIQSIPSTTDTLDKTKFKSFVESNSPTEIYFVITGHGDGEDISTNTTDNKPIYAWIDGTKMYVSAKEENERITLPSDSSFIFSPLNNLDDDAENETFAQLSKIDAKYLNTSSVTNMSGIFEGAGYKSTTFTLNLSNWDTSKVTNMSWMFGYAGSNATTFNLDLTNWNTSSVTNMLGMFAYAGGNATTWNIGDISNWDTSKVTNMSWMFGYAGSNATTWNIGDISNWNTSSVTNMVSMFYWAGLNATTFNLDLSNWNTSSVTNMESMFEGAGYKSTTFTLNLSNWDTSSVTDMISMFFSAGLNATNFSIKIKNNGRNTTSKLFGSDSVYAGASSNKLFTLID